jgi:hypothetical protein
MIPKSRQTFRMSSCVEESQNPEKLQDFSGLHFARKQSVGAEAMSQRPSRDVVAETIVALCAERGDDKTISPMEAAKAVVERESDGVDWRSRLVDVRKAAIALAKAGRIAIYRKGEPADPKNFKGVYRLGKSRAI